MELQVNDAYDPTGLTHVRIQECQYFYNKEWPRKAIICYRAVAGQSTTAQRLINKTGADLCDWNKLNSAFCEGAYVVLGFVWETKRGA